MGTFTYHVGYDLGRTSEVLASLGLQDKTELSGFLHRKAGLRLAKSCRWGTCGCTIVELTSNSASSHRNLPSASEFAEDPGLMGHSIEDEDPSGNWLTNWLETAERIHKEKLVPLLPADKREFDPDDVNVWARYEATIS